MPASYRQSVPYLVGERRAKAVHDGSRCEVLAGNQLQAGPLAGLRKHMRKSRNCIFFVQPAATSNKSGNTQHGGGKTLGSTSTCPRDVTNERLLTSLGLFLINLGGRRHTKVQVRGKTSPETRSIHRQALGDDCLLGDDCFCFPEKFQHELVHTSMRFPYPLEKAKKRSQQHVNDCSFVTSGAQNDGTGAKQTVTVSQCPLHD